MQYDFTSLPDLYEYLTHRRFHMRNASCEITPGGSGKVFVNVYNMDKLDAGDAAAQCQLTFVPNLGGFWTVRCERPGYKTTTGEHNKLLDCSRHIAYTIQLIEN
jgi:hypothetical protein